MINQDEYITSTAINVTGVVIENIWNKVNKYFKSLKAQESILYGVAYEKYLENTKDKYSKIKTLIYKQAPKDLYSFYECVGVRYDGKQWDTKSLNNLLRIGNKIVVSGSGGIGKTTLLKHLFLNCIEETDYIPVLIELRRINTINTNEISIYKMVYENLHENGFTLEEEYFKDSMKLGGYVILLDGYDEVKKDIINTVTQSIRELTNKYPNNNYILTSRPNDEFIGWNDFCEAQSLSLTKEQALNLINKIEFEETVKNKFYQELKERLFDKYKSFASNPLLLNIMLLTFDSHAAMPDKLNDFYEQAFSTLFNMHDATKEAFVRDIRCHLGCEDFRLVFSYICFKSYFRCEYELSELKLREYISESKQKFSNLHFSVDDYLEDLVRSVCMMVKEGLYYRFSHRSFQEYFAAVYTCKLTDKIQHDVLTKWIKERTNRSLLGESYFNMLYDMQSEKFNRIILVPGLKQIKKMYDEMGYSIDLLKKLFKSISIKQIKSDKFVFGLEIKNIYLCDILRLTIRLNQYSRRKNNEKKDKEIAEKFIKNGGKLFEYNSMSIDEVLQYLSEDDVLDIFEWFREQLDFGMFIWEKYDDSSRRKKKSLEELLEEI